MNGASRLGHKMAYTPDLIVYHPRKRTWTGLLRQFLGYGTGRGKQTRLDPRSLRPMHIVPAAFTLGFMASPLLALTFPVILPFLLLVAVLYASVVAVEAGRIAERENEWRSIGKLWAAFPAIHLSYGLGILVGLFARNVKPKGTAPTNRDVSVYPPR